MAALVMHIAAADARPVASRPITLKILVGADLSLEVRDWGGRGPPLVLLAGFGQTASNLDDLAQPFTKSNRVIAITRRGFRPSSAPNPVMANYTPERLAADTIAVLDKMQIRKAFIAGHSVAGQELSELGNRYSERVAGLIYLDAANAQAFYGAHADTLYPIAGEVRRDLEKLITSQPSEAPALIAKITNELPWLQRGFGLVRQSRSGRGGSSRRGVECAFDGNAKRDRPRCQSVWANPRANSRHFCLSAAMRA